MQVELELVPLKWCDTQASLYCGEDWILAYSVGEDGMATFRAACNLVQCHRLNRKHGLCRDVREWEGKAFASREDAVAACEAHYRELMLTAFLKAV